MKGLQHCSLHHKHQARQAYRVFIFVGVTSIIYVNITGCEINYATDQLLYLNNKQCACDLFIPAWIAIGTVLCSGKFILAAVHSLLWKLRRSRHVKTNNAKSHRFPLIPFLSWVLFIDYILLFAVPHSDTITPGLIPFFYGIGWMLWEIQSLFYLYKFISLESRIFLRRATTTQNSNEILSKLDLRGKIHTLLALIAIIGQTICMCILIFVYPYDYLLIQISHGFGGLFMLQLGFLWVNHFEKLTAIIKASLQATSTEQRTTDISILLCKLREQEISCFILIVLGAGFYFAIASGLLPATYYALTIFMCLETSGSLFILISNLKPLLLKKNKRISVPIPRISNRDELQLSPQI